MEFGANESYLSANGLTPQSVFQTLLIQRVANGEFNYIATEVFYSDSAWTEVMNILGETPGLKVNRVGEVRSNLNVSSFERANSAAVLTQDRWGEWELIVAVNDRAEAERWVGAIAALLPAPPPPPTIELPHNIVPVMFWMQDTYSGGAAYRRRNIEVTDWADIAANYPTTTRDQVTQVMNAVEPDGEGKLILFQGPPGTGKTRSILSLMSEWRDWCFSSVVTDADRLLGDPTYLNDLLFNMEGRGDYLLLVIEDGDEYVNVDEQSSKGQALSRILNMADGIMGQGLNMLTLISTNVAVEKLNPAMARPGRCMANIHFPSFSAAEALEWFKGNLKEEALAPEMLQMLAENKYGDAFSEDDTAATDYEFTLAELYEALRGD